MTNAVTPIFHAVPDFAGKYSVVYSFLFKPTTPFLMAAIEMTSTASMIAALVMADKVSISALSLFMVTMRSVFCSERIDTSASIKLMARSRRIRLFDDLFLLLRLTEAMVTLYVVCAAMAMEGISDIFTGFCRITIRDTGGTRAMFNNNSSAADAI